MAIRSSKSKGDQVIKIVQKHLEESDYSGKPQKKQKTIWNLFFTVWNSWGKKSQGGLHSFVGGSAY